MIVKRFVINSSGTNCYVFHRENGNEAVIIDPGSKNLKVVFDYLLSNNLKPVACLLTHSHFDHIEGIDEIVEKEIPVYASEKEIPLLENDNYNLSRIFGSPMTVSAASVMALKDGDIINLADFDIKVMETPGHTAGSVCYYIESENVLFTGDTLFCGTFGRTDFPTGNGKIMRSTLTYLLENMPPETICYAGHNEETTIASEQDLLDNWGFML
ncbi:MAG: MBL fold metallo-hydrolase [Lachnospiraceae bacterium]|nr:MBL fold metallo-hydrolase [Lachnospiraceae bacterium]